MFSRSGIFIAKGSVPEPFFSFYSSWIGQIYAIDQAGRTGWSGRVARVSSGMSGSQHDFALGDSWKTLHQVMQWSFRRSKRSYKLSFPQFVANSVLQLPCQAHTGACRGVVSTVRPGQLPDSCVLNSDGHRLGKCTKLFPSSCYAKRRHFWQFHRSEGSYDRLSCGVAPAGSLGRFASCPGILH